MPFGHLMHFFDIAALFASYFTMVIIMLGHYFIYMAMYRANSL